MMRSFAIIFAIGILLQHGTALSQNASTTTIGGYGELHYNEPDGHKRGMLDMHRFVVYFGHDFNEKLSFRSETEIEHTLVEAGNAKGGYLAIEQAFIDYRLNPKFGFRAGIMLIPVGLINQYHEPPTFNGVERPNVERNIIPTTWRESGAGIYGNLAEGLNYQLYLMAGLNASGFTSSTGLRSGRQKGFESNVANPTVTGRLDYAPLLGLQLGGSFFAGNSSMDIDSIGSGMVSMWSGDIRYTTGNFSFRALGVLASIGDAQLINAKYNKSVADRIFGYYIEGAYNILPVLCPEAEEVLDVFVRYEKYNTQAATTGFAPLKQFNRIDVVLGATFKPTHNTAFKIDYMFLNNAMNSGAFANTKQLNLGFGYYFF